ncbi:hypothetical protein [Alloalcanivorax xenomutans]|jgi:REP-associated tyrosine transposase|uniref:Transposase n=2 Tax=Alloalcanivorax xenomutans TaxID=1094342 RepID=A0A9Q3W3C2_9GAMM|nr:hypothetical protein [Alloalcanivorax xenomutans]MBA4723416.1 hypothetical protein [Alcanivorax sp.]MCE7508473.1 hypothetical protein [Alloalcanivorax xenomutans]MCE7521812.1 hypothetical protein [Alloalcanivorax xenomutans]PHS65784.1 MAG: hypothetical protein COB00_10465 [Alcanivorax sp.]CUR46448.1 Transposase and inactivated derivatives [Alloalcanivorax xenomutans]|tara:strand:- start:560 stop:1174 length:615 start_codon:yes stop_codon:yes gene_type:complete|eukprot:gnl/TRDRNA2_/TRDRNA2_174291_c0_seq2.p1 gnl/TRDRNA2_/TRDRNA2_174291_c0~~gnl/TRDRNA2_/TRDRNA2_174291_c0_seq2.p1  ORF type:complete len:205 (-),score=6.83 gnl/TRDRNA2_/TRDRNA2_174291_c0_seq2:67-681(-)
MPRTQRPVINGYFNYFEQCGDAMRSVFRDNLDCRRYLANLYELKLRFEVPIYAWCLLPVSASILTGPFRSSDDATEFMQSLSLFQVEPRRMPAPSTASRRWEQRFQLCQVAPGYWPLACMRYMEFLPVRAGECDMPWNYSWSSFRARMGIEPSALLDPYLGYLRMGNDEEDRRECYRLFMGRGVPDGEAATIREALLRASPLKG